VAFFQPIPVGICLAIRSGVIVATPQDVPVATAPLDRVIQVLSWTYRRDDETVYCQLGLAADYSAYELRIQPPWNPTGATAELFDDAVSAFQRHARVERLLINEGWSLERFDSSRVLR
jgi:hypothetical protein